MNVWAVVLGALWFVTLGLFVAYVVLDRQYFLGVERTLRDAPKIQRILPNLEPLKRRESCPLVGLIVEPREHHNLVPVIENFQRKLPGVPICVLHGVKNEAALRARFGDSLLYVSLECDNMTIKQYNYLMTRPELYHAMPGEHILVFQTDSVLFSKSAVKLEDYYEYDFVGAPWGNMEKFYVRMVFQFRDTNPQRYHAGNGGLSLRKRSAMIRVTEEIPFLSIPELVEDVYFTRALARLPDTKFPDVASASKLFYESLASPALPFGCHKHLPKGFDDQILPEEAAIITSYSQKSSSE